jgi:putative ABC transport system substrate-binding protein
MKLSLRTVSVILTLTLLASSVVSEGQAPGRLFRIGIVYPGSPPDPWVETFRLGLQDLGYRAGQNTVFEERPAHGSTEKLAESAAELVRLKVDVLVTMAGPAVLAAKQQSATIPIVMAISGDPLGLGLVSNLARPGGNITGVSLLSDDLAAKRLEALKEAVPRISRVAVLFNPGEAPTATELYQTRVAAQALRLTIQPLPVRDANDFEREFAAAVHDGANAFITFAHGFAFAHRRRIVDLAAKHRLPAMYGWREFAEEGGLLAYGPRVPDMLRRAAGLVDRILKGANPGDLPVEQPTTFEFVINLKTAKTLGVTIPQAVLLRADHVIE